MAKPKVIDEGRAGFLSRSILVRLDTDQFHSVMRGLLALDETLLPADGEIVGWWLDQASQPPLITLRIASREFDPVAPGEQCPEPIPKPYKDDAGRRWLGHI
jgi:hypothetical protein